MSWSMRMNAVALLVFIAFLLVQIVAVAENGAQLRGRSASKQEQQQEEGRDFQSDDPNVIKDNHSASKQEQQQEEGRDLQSDDPNIIKVIVEYTSEQGKNDAKDEALEITYESNHFNILGMRIPAKALTLLQNNLNIKRVDLDMDVQAILAIEDEDEEENIEDRRELAEEVPWGVKAVQANQVSPGPYAKDVKVCIIDTGYDLEHEDLPGSDTVTGSHSTKYSKRAGNRWNYDGQKKHGTHAAGIIAALGDNDLGVIGILPDASPTSFTLHISKGLTDDGRGSVSGVIEAIEGCIDAGSDIINMSLRVGGGFVGSFNYALQSAYEDHNILLVAAGKPESRKLVSCANDALSLSTSYYSWFLKL
jgi:subtilisin family serine protease